MGTSTATRFEHLLSYPEIDDGDTVWLTPAGVIHRIGGPAIERADGTLEWWQNGLRHRVDGPAAIHEDGEREWWFEGKRHRVGGPAVVEESGRKEWWRHGVRHRIDGPAILDHFNGLTFEDWWVHGWQMTGSDLELLTMVKCHTRLSDGVALATLSQASPLAVPVIAHHLIDHPSPFLTDRLRVFARLMLG